MFNYKYINNDIYYLLLFDLNDNDFLKYTNFMDNLYKKQKKFKLIFDLTKLSIYDSVYCNEQLKYMTTSEEFTKKYIEGTAIIVSNSIIKNLLDILIFSIKTPIKPNLITKDTKDALKFLINIKND